MRIKNEERWLQDVLDSIALTADGIVIFDDGSTDRTPEICQAHPAVLEYHRQDNAVLDEVRDKNILLKLALKHQPEWILCVDGDEILEDSAPERIFDAIRRCPQDVAVLDVEFLYMWDDLGHYRTDGIYARIFHHRLFTLRGQDADGAVVSAVGLRWKFSLRKRATEHLRGRAQEIDVKVKHLGYMRREDRARKYEWYKQHDPEHGQQGYYEHLLDQPGMTIAEWKERTFFENAEKLKSEKAEMQTRAANAGCQAGAEAGLLLRERAAESGGIDSGFGAARAGRGLRAGNDRRTAAGRTRD